MRFGKPVLLPAAAGLYVERVDGGWDIALRNMAKGYPHLTGTVRAPSGSVRDGRIAFPGAPFQTAPEQIDQQFTGLVHRRHRRTDPRGHGLTAAPSATAIM